MTVPPMPQGSVPGVKSKRGILLPAKPLLPPKEPFPERGRRQDWRPIPEPSRGPHERA